MAKQKREGPSFIEEARRKQILEVSQEIFAKNGFGQTSLAEIASEADISKGVIIYHFKSKAELGKAVLRNLLNRYGEYLVERLQKKRSAKSKLLEFPEICANYIIEHRYSFLLYIDTMGSFGTLSEKRDFMAEANVTQRAFLIKLIDACKAEGLFARLESQTLADILQAAIDGLMEQYSVDPKSTDLFKCAKVITAIIQNLMNEK